MKIAQGNHSSHPAPPGELTRLRIRLAEAEETLRAIRTGEVDAVVITAKKGAQVFTLEGAEHPLPWAHRVHERRGADADG